jgi:hypothetical protein
MPDGEPMSWALLRRSRPWAALSHGVADLNEADDHEPCRQLEKDGDHADEAPDILSEAGMAGKGDDGLGVGHLVHHLSRLG